MGKNCIGYIYTHTHTYPIQNTTLFEELVQYRSLQMASEPMSNIPRLNYKHGVGIIAKVRT